MTLKNGSGSLSKEEYVLTGPSPIPLASRARVAKELVSLLRKDRARYTEHDWTWSQLTQELRQRLLTPQLTIGFVRYHVQRAGVPVRICAKIVHAATPITVPDLAVLERQAQRQPLLSGLDTLIGPATRTPMEQTEINVMLTRFLDALNELEPQLQFYPRLCSFARSFIQFIGTTRLVSVGSTSYREMRNTLCQTGQLESHRNHLLDLLRDLEFNQWRTRLETRSIEPPDTLGTPA